MDVPRLQILSEIKWNPDSAYVPVYDPSSPGNTIVIDLMKWIDDTPHFENNRRSHKVNYG